MTVGLIGLDNIGISLAQNLMQHKITVVAFDTESANRMLSADMGIITTSSIQAVALHLPSPRIIWNMVTSSSTDEEVMEKIPNWLSPGDIIIDGSGTKKDDIAHFYEKIKEKELLLLRCKPISPMHQSIAWISGDSSAFTICKPMFHALFGELGYQYMGDILPVKK